MTVLIVSHLLARAVGGGVMMRSVGVARALMREGVTVRLLTTDVGMTMADREQLADLAVTILPNVLPRFAVPVSGPSRAADLVREASVVLLFNHWTLLNALVYHLARRHGVPHIVCPSGALTLGVRSHTLKRIYDATVGKRLVRDAAAGVATTTREVADFAPYGLPDARISVIPNAVESVDPPGDETVASWRRRHGLGDAPLLLFMGRLNPIKGPDLLIEAFARVAGAYPRYRLVLAGPDEGLHDALTAQAAAHGIGPRVHFVGLLDRNDRDLAYRAASLLVVPSRQEAMSLVALEAGAQGTPVLMTDVCGFDDLARAGGGLLVPPTVDGLADGLRRLLDAPTELESMGARLRRLIESSYGWSSVAPRWVAVLAAASSRRADGRSARNSARTPA